MSKNHFAGESDDDMEEVPNEFQRGVPTPSSYYDTDRFQPTATMSILSHYPLSKQTKTQISESFLQKHQQYLASRLQKFKDIKQQEDQRVMADCTFKPHINKSASKSPRNIQQFIESQQKFLNKTKEKKEWLKQRLEEDNKKNMTFSPKINRKKDQKNKENVHSRLYNNKNKDGIQSRFNQSFTYIPKITKKGENLVRKMPVNELLYLDAQRRAERYFDPVESQTVNIEKHYLHDKYVAQKFLKDFKNVLQSTQLLEKMTYNEEQLTLILKELGYVSGDASVYEERKLIHDCFSYLSKCGVTQINVYIFLLALGGIYNVDLNNKEIKSALVIEEDEGKKIHHHYDRLFRNKLYNATLKKSKSAKQEIFQRQSISPENQKLANKYRQKMIKRTNKIFSDHNIGINIPEKGLSHEDLLVIYSLGKNLQKESIKKNKSKEKDPECTFQPNSSKYSMEFINKQIGEERCKQMYEQAKIRQEESRLPTFRSFDNQQQNTFFKKENISPIKTPPKMHLKSNVNSYLEIKDVDKTLSRMVMGRRQRQQKLELEERGELSRRKGEKQQKVKTFEHSFDSAQNQLILDADILVNNVKKKIYIYRKDQNRIDDVVEDFAKKCDLDFPSRDMLYERLMDAMQSLRKEQKKQ